MCASQICEPLVAASRPVALASRRACAGVNENGIFAVLGREEAQFAVKGPFKWPLADRGKTVCAFQPTSARCRLGPFEREWPLAADPSTAALWSTGAPEAAAVPFEDAKVTKLPFFRFLLVDETVAVALGRSGGVAVWAS